MLDFRVLIVMKMLQTLVANIVDNFMKSEQKSKINFYQNDVMKSAHVNIGQMKGKQQPNLPKPTQSKFHFIVYLSNICAVPTKFHAKEFQKMIQMHMMRRTYSNMCWTKILTKQTIYRLNGAVVLPLQVNFESSSLKIANKYFFNNFLFKI